ncbi:2,3-bisphosphoglycerate-independent phosphoglycerate mutase [Azospirillum rugosum]|uniref:2,3-bisphosphoglycerate-independent phosphoglycerate mutase n=1 Tax=Azospirillum rugosum TaxID=416170 RepID=A0ABS4SRQ4_9PROT|nr:2,3-bisphosphoglycerate-independent phosphoglycerate mutase [Azospirillum rugosum]MBP2295228.1 2,3-bisphosphoglycerate-independent phosphoglycerate mutase [Azospirillum rugosum]MDQ0528602.1 2,3-bisphosphoglycerate-independent phosphoglycerate mutase [Azospirillum rugosum]
MTETKRPRPVVLCILDGWGYREERTDNAIALADTPTWDRLWSSEPRAFLEASEEEVGLPKGQMGNSEVGHMNLGAGRVVMQDLVMIDHAIVQGEFERNTALNDLVKALHKTGGRCHILGLLSPGGVHSHQDHIAALAAVLAREGVPVEVHAFTDGRDVPPQSAKDQVAEFMADVHELAGVNVATVSGRYYAMDRDKRWDRVAKAYAAIVRGEGERAADPIQAIEQSYATGKHDEFILPTIIDGYTGLKDGDAILMANFRADRAREILAAFVDPAFDGFDRGTVPALAAAVGMVEYSSALAKLMTTIFPPKSLTKVLGEVVSEAGLTQLRIAETEKYPHVTFFFNGGEERVYPGEDRILVPSPKVATYDLQPEMSAEEVTDKVVEAVDSGTYDLIVINYANPDMVGHTGFLDAAMKAVQAVDTSLGRLEAAVRRQGGVMLVTADHGNCEMMTDPETHGPHTAHTLDKVPLVLVNGPADVKAIRSGRLADIAPTLLDLMKLPKPAEMTGASLLDRAAAQAAAE